MIKKLLSRYGVRYPRSLVYILQASEYKISDYFDWYRHVKDFNRVEQRKTLVKTSKAIVMLIFSWLILILLYLVGLFFLITGSSLVKLLSLILLLLAPSILAYVIVIPLIVVWLVIQKPVEFILIRRTKQKLAKHPAVKIGIAGSFGKTSLREILKTVIAEGKIVATPANNFNTPMGIIQFVKGLTGKEEVLIFEFGEYYPGDVAKLCDLVQPDLGVITGVNEAHLNKFKSLDQTAKTIFELADFLGSKTLYVNAENELAKTKAKKDCLLYSRQGVGEFKIEEAQTDLTGTSFVLVHGKDRLLVRSHLLGLHQIGPLTAAANISFHLGLSLEQIQKGLAQTKPFDHRLEPKTDASGVITLDDSYNGNPDGVKVVIDFLGSLTGHRRFYVTPGLVEMGSKTEVVHKQIGQKLSQAGIEKVVLIKNSVTPYIEAGLIEAGYQGEILWFDDALKAFKSLPLMTIKGDVVLLQNDWPDQYR